MLAFLFSSECAYVSFCEHTFLRVYVCANVISSKISVYRKHSNTYEHGNLYTCSTNIQMTWITIHKQTERQTDKQTWHIHCVRVFVSNHQTRHIHCVRILYVCLFAIITGTWRRIPVQSKLIQNERGTSKKGFKTNPDVEIPNLGTLLTAPSERLAKRFPTMNGKFFFQWKECQK